MSIQYAPSRVSATFFGTTIAQLKSAINTQLVNAGWSSSVSGGGFIVTTSVTPQGLQAAINLQDDGTNVTIQFQNVAATQLGFTHITTPAANKRYQIIANAYQFFLFLPNVSTVGSGAVMGGVPWLPSFLGTGTCIWSLGDSNSQQTFRNSFQPNCNSSTFMLNANVGTGAGIGSPRLIGVQSNATTLGLAGLWFNNAAIICEPMLAFGTSQNAIPVVVGELWDTALVMNPYQLDLTTTFDTHNYQNFTDNNAGGSVFIATS